MDALYFPHVPQNYAAIKSPFIPSHAFIRLLPPPRRYGSWYCPTLSIGKPANLSLPVDPLSRHVSSILSLTFLIRGFGFYFTRTMILPTILTPDLDPLPPIPAFPPLKSFSLGSLACLSSNKFNPSFYLPVYSKF